MTDPKDDAQTSPVGAADPSDPRVDAADRPPRPEAANDLAADSGGRDTDERDPDAYEPL
jgi:hypothetical protein